MSTIFGRYTLLRQLATGGMSEILLARDNEAESDYLVVIKRILPEYAGRQRMVNMFLDEARLASLLVHPNIVRNSPPQQLEDSWYIVQEFVDGSNLDKLMRYMELRSMVLPERLAAYVIVCVADALEHAHAVTDPETDRPLKLVHRDVTPRNVLLSREGAVKLSDFGIAKAEGRKSRTMTGVAKGTVGYMSPEQAQVRPLNHRSDIFSLGIILHELLTGRSLFSGEADFVVMQRIARETVAPPSATRASVDPVLDGICAKMMRREPEHRYQTGGELADALFDWLDEHGCDHGQDEMRDWLELLRQGKAPSE